MLRGRQAAEGHGVLAGEHSGRARRAAAVRVGADRARRADQPPPFDGRIYLIVLDDLHTTPLPRAHRVRWRRASSSSATSAPTTGGGRAHQRPRPTPRRSSPTTSAAAGGGRQVHGPQAPVVGHEQDRRVSARGTPVGDAPATDRRSDDKERGFNARNTLDTIRKKLAEFLGGMRGRRKAIVLFSEGIDYDINDVFNNAATRPRP